MDLAIEPVAPYSAHKAEQRPKLKAGSDSRVSVVMDASPANNYK
jgi:hypothetical protein